MASHFGVMSAAHDAVSGPVHGVLGNKSRDIWSLAPEASVYDAIKLMADKSIGLVLVMEGARLVGVVSERDYARKVVLQSRQARSTQIGEIMSAPVISISPQTSVAECMRLMTEHRVRHIPVVDRDRVVGVISIGDVIKYILSAQTETLQVLSGYVANASL